MTQQEPGVKAESKKTTIKSNKKTFSKSNQTDVSRLLQANAGLLWPREGNCSPPGWIHVHQGLLWILSGSQPGPLQRSERLAGRRTRRDRVTEIIKRDHKSSIDGLCQRRKHKRGCEESQRAEETSRREKSATNTQKATTMSWCVEEVGLSGSVCSIVQLFRRIHCGFQSSNKLTNKMETRVE